MVTEVSKTELSKAHEQIETAMARANAARKVAYTGDTDPRVPVVEPTVELEDGTKDNIRVFSSVVQAPDFVTIYDRATGIPSTVMKYMAVRKLMMQDKGGKPLWSTAPIPGLPKEGTFKCLFHPDNPDREQYAALGFRPCSKANIPSQFFVLGHMEKKHGGEWKQMQEGKTRAFQEETTTFQKKLLNALAEAAMRQQVVPPTIEDPVANTETKRSTTHGSRRLDPAARAAFGTRMRAAREKKRAEREAANKVATT